MLLLSWMYNAPLLAQIAGTATFTLFLNVIWKQMKRNSVGHTRSVAASASQQVKLTSSIAFCGEPNDNFISNSRS